MIYQGLQALLALKNYKEWGHKCPLFSTLPSIYLVSYVASSPRSAPEGLGFINIWDEHSHLVISLEGPRMGFLSKGFPQNKHTYTISGSGMENNTSHPTLRLYSLKGSFNHVPQLCSWEVHATRKLVTTLLTLPYP